MSPIPPGLQRLALSILLGAFLLGGSGAPSDVLAQTDATVDGMCFRGRPLPHLWKPGHRSRVHPPRLYVGGGVGSDIAAGAAGTAALAGWAALVAVILSLPPST